MPSGSTWYCVYHLCFLWLDSYWLSNRCQILGILLHFLHSQSVFHFLHQMTRLMYLCQNHDGSYECWYDCNLPVRFCMPLVCHIIDLVSMQDYIVLCLTNLYMWVILYLVLLFPINNALVDKHSLWAVILVVSRVILCNMHGHLSACDRPFLQLVILVSCFHPICFAYYSKIMPWCCL